tara:strand:- start:52 stop:234 length:183 start_codon:yes stop_codon:yes gene_type:complete
MKDFLARATSRKFISFLLTLGSLGALAWFGRGGVDGWTIAAVFGAYAGAQGLVDASAARK